MMYFASIWALAGLLSLASVVHGQSRCAIECFQSVITEHPPLECTEPNMYLCFCKMPSLQNYFIDCVYEDCPAASDAAIAFGVNLCADLGVPITVPPRPITSTTTFVLEPASETVTTTTSVDSESILSESSEPVLGLSTSIITTSIVSSPTDEPITSTVISNSPLESEPAESSEGQFSGPPSSSSGPPSSSASTLSSGSLLSSDAPSSSGLPLSSGLPSSSGFPSSSGSPPPSGSPLSSGSPSSFVSAVQSGSPAQSGPKHPISSNTYPGPSGTIWAAPGESVSGHPAPPNPALPVSSSTTASTGATEPFHVEASMATAIGASIFFMAAGTAIAALIL